MNYSELQAQVAEWMNRSDLTSVIPSFIALAEERFNRHLRVRAMEIALEDEPIADNKVTLDGSVVDVKLLWTGAEPRLLMSQSLEAVIAGGTTGEPTMFARQGQMLQFNGTGSVSGVLYQKIPALATASSNWLSVQAPSAYLFGAMVEAKGYTGGDPMPWESRLQAVLNELAGNDNRYSGPLVARAR
jgi:hypothetical protein